MYSNGDRLNVVYLATFSLLPTIYNAKSKVLFKLQIGKDVRGWDRGLL
jgi:hypothetical protein